MGTSPNDCQKISVARPDAAAVRAALRYDPETGKLYRFVKSRGVEVEAFTAKSSYGYHVGSVLGYKATAHTVIWAIIHGAWPVERLDHISGDRADNRQHNLREVTPVENNQNAAMPKNNTSGIIGVSWFDRRQIWRAQITVRKKQIHLGNFRSRDEAAAARKAAEIRLGFHPNHGRRAA